ncbi:hypothetical protein CC86DRAFT_79694 [Ophiobolus disseminans]|uniref:Uncharacterized protein n=1 Tax=Ophiobolus disseminans TaxID=1469910 RepID=A0A6A6ZQD1_9PLEO|nr:hypothetical protein CC86DRAFT_79694 [Ophiobolus disseminans]
MADEIRQAPTATSTHVGEVQSNSQTNSIGPPKSSNSEDSKMTEVNNEKHFSTAPTLNAREADADLKNPDEKGPQLPPRHSAVQFEQHPDIQHVPYSPIFAPNDYRNTGTWTDSAYPKKPDFDVEAREVDYDDGIDWKPGKKDQFPWIGFAGFVTIVIATAMAVAILALSDKKLVTEWPFRRFPIQPNVLLNIANQVQNLGLITLVGQGLAIAWWRKALRGSSLRTLHRNHAYSYSVYSILTSGKHFNIIALAALMTKFAVIDSTLFQKATKTIVTQEKNYTNATVTGWIEQQWTPKSGGIPGDEGNIKTVDKPWANVIDAYNLKIANGKVHDLLNERSSFFDCPYRQECFGKVQGIGFAFSCNTSTEDVDYGIMRRGQQGGVQSSFPLWDVKFDTEWSTPSKPYANVRLDMLYVDSNKGSSNESCPGTLTRRVCGIRPAIVEYPVTVMMPSKQELAGGNIVTHIKFFDDNQNWTLSAPLDTEQIDGLKVVKYVDLDENYNEVSTVGAMTYVFNNLYSSNANLTYTTGWDIQSRGSQAQTIFYAENDRDEHSKCYYDINKPGRDDPAFELLRKVNTLGFVAGLYLKGAASIDRKDREKSNLAHQTFETAVTGIVEQYQTSFAYVGGALAATLITVLLVLPVYWGFWQLGRKVTLGPLEISHAFNAPIIRPAKIMNHHGDFEEVLNDVGKRRVQYGQLVGRPAGEMGIAEPHKVATPDARHGGQVLHNKSNRRIAMGAAIGGVVAATLGGNAK